MRNEWFLCQSVICVSADSDVFVLFERGFRDDELRFAALGWG